QPEVLACGEADRHDEKGHDPGGVGPQTWHATPVGGTQSIGLEAGYEAYAGPAQPRAVSQSGRRRLDCQPAARPTADRSASHLYISAPSLLYTRFLVFLRNP